LPAAWDSFVVCRLRQFVPAARLVDSGDASILVVVFGMLALQRHAGIGAILTL